ncbi:N-acetylneuraminate epimerase [compost metagenome]
MEGLPLGSNRLLVLQGLDAEDRPLPGAEWLAVAPLATGSNQVVLSSAATAVGKVWARWLDTGHRSLAQQADPAQVARRLEALKRASNLPHHALIDANQWADAVAAASGSLEVPGTFAIAPGSALVTVTGAPAAVSAELWIDDPVSPLQSGVSPVTTQTGGRYRVGPVMPGIWTAWVSVPGFGVASRSLSVPAGGEASVKLEFKGWEAGPKLPVALGNAGYATDGRHLYVVGGVRQGGATSAACWKLDTHATNPTWQPLPDMPSPRDGAACVVIGRTLYVVGGYTKGTGYRQDALSLSLDAGQPAWLPLSEIPSINGRPLSQLGYPVGAFSLDGKLTVLINAFGDLVGEAPFDRSHTAQYDPVLNAWFVDANGVPTIRTPRDRAGFTPVVVQGAAQLMVAGGDKPDIQENRGSYGFLFRSATPRVEALDLSRRQWAGWPDLPTGRSELAIAQAGSSLYAVGGVDNQEHSLETVERLDLGTRRWLPGPPLATPRSSFGLLVAGGRLWAIGGSPSLFLNDMAGGSARALDSVEVLEVTP